MKILIGCEFSGVVREAFRALGHDAWSCDLLPAEDGSPFHYKCTIGTALEYKWGVAGFHPPCKFLCNSGARWLYKGGKKKNGKDLERWADMYSACDFFASLYHCEIPHFYIENSIMHEYARDYLLAVHNVPTYSQIIEPWEHGHGEIKRTCLWIRGLPPLIPTEIVSGRTPRVHHASPGPDRWKERSRTLPGIAKAMAEQWTKYLNGKNKYE